MYTLGVQHAADMTSKSGVIGVCLMLRATVQPVLSKHLRDNQNLLA